jgi:hypothetical protein
MVADDAAVARVGAGPVHGALTRLSDPHDPQTGEDRRRRLDRLDVPPATSPALTVVVVLAAVALLVLPTVVVVVPWLDAAVSNWPL